MKCIVGRAAKAGPGSQTGRERAKMRTGKKPLPLQNTLDNAVGRTRMDRADVAVGILHEKPRTIRRLQSRKASVELADCCAAKRQPPNASGLFAFADGPASC